LARGAPVHPQDGTKERPQGANKGTARSEETIDDVAKHLTAEVCERMSRQWRIGLPGTCEHWRPKWPVRGLSANQIEGALISMMARSKRSNQRPDTLTQDRISQVVKTSCTARPCGLIGRVEETSASFEARSAPRLYPTERLGVDPAPPLSAACMANCGTKSASGLSSRHPWQSDRHCVNCFIQMVCP
jgi:hypothetical protein